jgi:hypothetical protein
MAKKKKESVAKAYFVRLTNGDDLITEITKKTLKLVSIKHPMLLITNVEMEEGRQTLIMYPWIPQGVAVGNIADIKTETIVLLNEIEPEIADHYFGMCQYAFAEKPTAITSSSPKASELEANKGKNVISFGAAKNKKELLLES